jgi:putative ABC transport system permease protein
MQPVTPVSFRKGTVERIGVWRMLDQPTRMIVRSLERFPTRAALTVAGLSVSLSLLVGPQFMFTSMDGIVDRTYFRAHRWSDEIGFGEMRDVHAVPEVARLPAVLRVEPLRNEPGRMRANAREERIGVVGLDDGAELAHPLDAQGRSIAFEGRGVVLSTALAAHLAVRAGDAVELEIMDGRRPRAVLPVTAIAGDYAGFTAYMARGALNRVMGDGDVASGADLVVAPDQRNGFYRAITRMPQVVGAASRDDNVASFRSAVADILTIEMTFFLGFAAAIAFGVAYNICRVTLADRSRDLATLCVLGFDRVECAYILSGELVFLALLATPIGVAGGLALGKALVAAFSRQDFYLAFTITAKGLGLAFATYLGAVILATAMVVQRIWKLDLVTVLKTRE